MLVTISFSKLIATELEATIPDLPLPLETSPIKLIQCIVAGRDISLAGPHPAAVIVLHNGIFNSCFRSHYRLNVIAGHELYVVQCEDVCGVGHCQGKGSPGPAYGDKLIFLGGLSGNKFDDAIVYLELHQGDGRNTILFTEEGNDLGFLK